MSNPASKIQNIVIFSQSSGTFTFTKIIDGAIQATEEIGTGWSGCGEGKNNPEKQEVRSVGPLPRGRYKVGPPKQESTGPYSLRLTPLPETEMYGRDGFLCHGPSKGTNYGEESHGCPILARAGRERLVALGVEFLDVVE